MASLHESFIFFLSAAASLLRFLHFFVILFIINLFVIIITQMKMMDFGSDVSILPKGWRREEVVRAPGLSAGKIDVVYVSPGGLRFRSKLQLAKYLGDAIDLTAFDFKTGKLNPSLLRGNRSRHHHHGHRGSSRHDTFGRSSRNDASLIPPIRQTASIFKQPVTLVETQPGGKTKDNLPSASSRSKADLEKPRQVFWEKRIQGLKATSLGDEDLLTPEDTSNTSSTRLLPRCIKPVPGADVSEDTALRSVSAVIHRVNQAIVGQTVAKGLLEKNPGVYVNPEQPLVTAIVITDEDMLRQESRVRAARRSLQEAILAAESV